MGPCLVWRPALDPHEAVELPLGTVGRTPLDLNQIERDEAVKPDEDTIMPISAPAMSTSKRTLTAALEAGDLQAAVAASRQDIVSQTPILASVGDEVRGLPTLAKILQTAFTFLGMPQNVEEFQNPDGRYIVTFDGAVCGHLIQIAWLVTEDAEGKVQSIRAFIRPWPVVKLFREYMERRQRPDPVPDALWELSRLKKLRDDRKLPV